MKEIAEGLAGLRGRLHQAILSHGLTNEQWLALLEELDGLTQLVEDSYPSGLLVKESTLERLGLVSKVANLDKAGLSPKDIAGIILTQTGVEVSEKDIVDALAYEGPTTYEKSVSLRGSIFDTQRRFQEVFEHLYDTLEKIKLKDELYYKGNKLSRDEVELEYLRELRQLSKDAAAIVAAVSAMSRLRDFQKAVLDVIGTVSPSVQQQILRKLNEQKALISSLVPDT